MNISSFCQCLFYLFKRMYCLLFKTIHAFIHGITRTRIPFFNGSVKFISFSISFNLSLSHLISLAACKLYALSHVISLSCKHFSLSCNLYLSLLSHVMYISHFSLSFSHTRMSFIRFDDSIERPFFSIKKADEKKKRNEIDDILKRLKQMLPPSNSTLFS